MMGRSATGVKGGGATPAKDAESAVRTAIPASDGKAPRTARGERTLRKILDAARQEFGERGFSDSSIVTITARAKVALGTFYTYFDSKEAVFRALVRDMSEQVRDAVAPELAEATDTFDGERRALAAFLRFVRRNQGVYRIIDEAEFVDPEGFRRHYHSTAERIAARLEAGAQKGSVAQPADTLDREVQAWAVMGANVFIGLRFGIWGEEDGEAVAAAANRLFKDGLAAR